jgi:hypothetical protein
MKKMIWDAAKWIGIRALIYGMFLLAAMMSLAAEAKCRWRHVDHDYNSSTPAVYREICDKPLDIRTTKPVEPVKPIQSNRLRPLDNSNLLIPPVGTRDCRQQRVYNRRAREWVDTTICE